MPSGYIDDGYTLEHTIAAKSGKFDEVTIHYRPLLRRELWHHHERVKKAREAEDLVALDDATAELLERHIASWTICDRNKKEVPVTKETILDLEFNLFGELVEILMGSVEVDEEAAKN